MKDSEEEGAALRSWMGAVAKIVEGLANRPPENHSDFVACLTDDQLALNNGCRDAVRSALDEIIMPLSEEEIVWDCFPAFVALAGEIEDVVGGCVANAAVPLDDALGYVSSARVVLNTVLDDVERRVTSK